MRIQRTFFLIFALGMFPLSAEAFSYTRSFDGVTARCDAQNISVTPGPHREYDIRGGKGGEIALFVSEEKGDFRYTIRGESVRIPPRNLGSSKRVFTLPAWAFTCTISSEERAAHTCDGKLKGQSGSCIVCREGTDKDRCKRLTFAITRQAQKAPLLAGP